MDILKQGKRLIDIAKKYKYLIGGMATVYQMVVGILIMAFKANGMDTQ
ncbi:hypothetical protein KTC92_14905 [Clostridium sp. CM027]|nr:hypothetical protein [Clostridium sp. CM027]MBW9145270.1 hypothetical protein [Clostridium sp. CM027]UVE40399.1 hypothetical protein KTC92_14905 [Clostridium sp. CM027]